MRIALPVRIGLVLAMMFTAGCLGTDSGPPLRASTSWETSSLLVNEALPFYATDPIGDATDTGMGGAATMVACAVGEVAANKCISSSVTPPRAGTEGPHYDITGVRIDAETDNDVVIALEIASLSESFSELDPGNGLYRMNYYRVCWSVAADETSCNRVVVLDVMKRGTVLHVEPKFEIRSAECNEWNWCSWGIPAKITSGTPATITFEVPKAYIGETRRIHSIQAETGWISEPEAFPAWHPGITLHTPAYHVHHHGGAIAGLAISDTTEPFEADITLAAGGELPSHDPRAPLLLGHPGNNHGAGGPYDYPEMDILWFDIHEDAGDMVSVFTLANFEQIPQYDFDYSVGVGLGSLVWEIGYRQEGGKLYGYAGRCIMEMCQDGEIMTPVVDATFGTPGTIAIRVPLKFIGSPQPGTLTNLFWAMSMYSDVNYYYGDYEDETFGDYHSVFMIDSLVGGAPYQFGSGHKAEGSATHDDA